MDKEKKDIIPISPVTFVSGDVSTDQSINTLFTSAYDSKIVTDLGHSLMIDEVKKTVTDPEDDLFYNWARDVYHVDRQGLFDAVTSYVIVNISDLVYSTLLGFLGKFNVDNSHTMIGHYLAKEVVNFDIQTEVTNAIAAAGLCMNREYSPEQLYVINSMTMDTVYSMLYTKIFEKYIMNHINFAIQIDAFETLYNLLYYANFDKDPKSYPDVQTMYAFCSSMLRELMEPFMQEFRLALMLVAKSATTMVVESPKYALHSADLEYRTIDAIESCSQFAGLMENPPSIKKRLGDTNE